MDTFVGLILSRNGELLLQLRDNKVDIWSPGFWNLPGGKAEDGESPLVAVVREFREETGYYLHHPTQFMAEQMRVGEKEICRVFFFEEYDGLQELSCFEGQRVEFFSRIEIDSLKFVADHLPVIDSYLRSRPAQSRKIAFN